MKLSPPLLLAGAAGLAAFLYMRQASAAPASAAASQRVRLPVGNTGRPTNAVQYANGQTMAELLARTVNTAWGIWADVPKTAAATVGSPEARAAIRQSESPGYYGWSGATVTAVAPDATAQGNADAFWSDSMADGIPAGPVYDVGEQTDPYVWTGPEVGGAVIADRWLDGWGT